MTRHAAARRSPDDQPAYARDVYGWALRQARLIREGRFDQVDRENVAEEIESLGRSERSALRSYLTRVLQHMLKWDVQPERRTPSWQTSIRVHRLNAERQLRDNPGLKGELDGLVDDAYRTAVIFAAEETGLAEEDFPRACPWSFDEVMGRPPGG